MGIKFVDITFSVMKGDKFVIGALSDSMIMNLGKGASVSLSEESDLFWLHLNLLFEKEAISVICFSLVLCSITEFNLRREWTNGESHSLWLRREYNTSVLVLRARFQASAKFWFL